MITLPLIISVPHSGLGVPREAEPYSILTPRQIEEYGDEGAAEIYHGLRDHVVAFVTTPIACAFVDVNRAEDDRRPDGVIKTHTCLTVPMYKQAPPEDVIDQLLARYYRPYQARLSAAPWQGVRLGIDCHTMAGVGPPIGPGPGVERPSICLGNAEGTCPNDWTESLPDCLEQTFQCHVFVNDPFRGGFIIQSHAHELPWMQLELSRVPCLSPREQRRRVLKALRDWCRRHGVVGPHG